MGVEDLGRLGEIVQTWREADLHWIFGDDAQVHLRRTTVTLTGPGGAK